MRNRTLLVPTPVFKRGLAMFIIIVTVIGFFACTFAYQKDEIYFFSEVNMQLRLFSEKCEAICGNFYELYVPIFEKEGNKQILLEYFRSNIKEDIDPLTKKELTRILTSMEGLNNRIQWIALYSPHRDTNYIVVRNFDYLQVLPEDFAYAEELTNKNRQMEIYPQKTVELFGEQYQSIAISGGSGTSTLSGSIMLGFSTSALDQICTNEMNTESLMFAYVYDGKTIYSSVEGVSWDDASSLNSGSYKLKKNGEKWYVSVAREDLTKGKVLYAVKNRELNTTLTKSVRSVLTLVVLLTVLAFGLSFFGVNSVKKEVSVIQDALQIIGQNNLDYQIDYKFSQAEFTFISRAINEMTRSLKDKIECINAFEHKQAEAEMKALQARFNPHFLYNTLEIFRSRCSENGDDDTAEMIAQTAALFRGFISPNTFIPIQEELATCKRYLALFRQRYGESVKIKYDIDSDVLQYGIIRNVFQPLIENYFEHGYNSSIKDNYFFVSGELYEDDSIRFTVEDNGLGLDENKLNEINANLDGQISSEQESYGLKNLHQRIRLFYGDKYGITLQRNEKSGVKVVILIGRKKYSNENI